LNLNKSIKKYRSFLYFFQFSLKNPKSAVKLWYNNVYSIEKETFMKTKTLAQIDGIIGLITGIILAILPFVIVMIAGISEDEDAAAVIVGMMFIAFALVKIAILILGILTLIYYKDDKRITLAPSILFIVGAVVSLIPFLGWIGGIVIIIGAALYLSSLKQFQIQE